MAVEPGRDGMFKFDPPPPWDGDWPKDGTPEARAFDNQIRPMIQALKFVAAYREEWARLESEFGRREVLEALGHYRSRQQGAAALQRRLHDLTVYTPGYAFGPVDPHDLEDFGPIPTVSGCLDTWWFLRNGSIRLRALVDESEFRRLEEAPGCLLAVIDLNWPDSEILDAVKALRRTYGPEKPTLRPKARRSWADDGAEGLREAFQLLKIRAVDTERTLWRIGGDVLKRNVDTEDAKRAASDAVRRLLQLAQEWVDEMTYWHSADRASPIPNPPLIHLSGE